MIELKIRIQESDYGYLTKQLLELVLNNESASNAGNVLISLLPIDIQEKLAVEIFNLNKQHIIDLIIKTAREHNIVLKLVDIHAEKLV